MYQHRVQADVILTASENANSFGHFDQNATNTTTAPPAGTFLVTPTNPGVSAMGPAACAPTSAANSFIFLQNQYNLTLGLVDLGNPYGTISTLASGAYMGTSPATANANSQTGYSGGGTSPGGFALGKEKYLQNKFPNGITSNTGQKYAIQTVGQNGYGAFSQAANGPWVGGIANTTPTAAFIQQQLAAGEDVEMFFAWTDSTGTNPTPGHVVTLTGINYDQTTNSGNISFIDPTNNVGGNITYGTGDAPNITSIDLTKLVNGYLVFGYKGGASGIASDDNTASATYGEIVSVFAESPVPIPEPASMALLALGGLGLLLKRGKKAA
jgi:hypothetical protein